MALSDWTIPVGSSDGFTPVTLPNDTPSGEANPCLELTKQTDGNSTRQFRMLYPTSGTIDGTDVTGLNSGQVEVSLKFTETKSVTEKIFGPTFRVSDAARSSFTGYGAGVRYRTSADQLLLYRVSSGTATLLETSSMPITLNQSTWYKFRFTWTRSGGNLVILGEVDNSGYTAINGSGYVDNSPNGDSSSHKVGLASMMAGNVASTVRTDGLYVYS